MYFKILLLYPLKMPLQLLIQKGLQTNINKLISLKICSDRYNFKIKIKKTKIDFKLMKKIENLFKNYNIFLKIIKQIKLRF